MPEADDLIRRVLSHLYAAPDAFLHARREGDTPFSVLDNAAATAAPEWLDLVPRSAVRWMVEQGYLEGGPNDKSEIIVYRLSADGRRRLDDQPPRPDSL